MNLLTAFIRFYFSRSPANATALRKAIKLAVKV